METAHETIELHIIPASSGHCKSQGCIGEGGEGCYVNHTNTTGSHISGNHDGTLAILEFLQDPVSFVLLFVSMDGFVRQY